MNIELLAPVGSIEAMKAAVQNGANAIYLGGKVFSARQYAQNFDEEELKEAVKYCHIRGVKVYVTVNTLVSNEELIKLLEYISFLYDIDVDALIVQDLGVAKLVKDFFPDFELHGSTQMTVHSLEGVKLLEEMGFKRVVLSREMEKNEIKYIRENSKMELEIFIHGALCISYSGQCLMSSMIGGRSGNRGRCAQPCRKPYELLDLENKKVLKSKVGDYLLSPRDLNTLAYIDEILDLGATSLKIEGRMKRPEYVATIVKAYREAIDLYLMNKKVTIDQDMMGKVEKVFNRKFTKGYLLGDEGKNLMSFEKPSNRGVKIGKVIGYDKRKKRVKIQLENELSKGDGIQIWTQKGDSPGCIVDVIWKKGEKVNRADHKETVEIPFKDFVENNMLVYKTSDYKLLKWAQETYDRKDVQIPISGEFIGNLGEQIELTLWDENGNFVHEKGQEAEKAIKVATNKDRIESQIKKLGNTPYILKNFNVILDEGVSISAKEMNNLRRTCIDSLNKLRKKHNNREKINNIEEKLNNWLVQKTSKAEKQRLNVLVNNLEQLEATLNFPIDRIYYTDIDTLEEALDMAKNKNIELFISFGRITEDYELLMIKEKLSKIKDIPGVLVTNLGILNMVKDLDIYMVSDYSLNVFNNGAIKSLTEMGIKECTLSLELTLKQIKEIIKKAEMPIEVIIHGNIPLMISKFCPTSSILGEGKRNCKICENKELGLKDPLGVIFPIVKDNNCRIQILNSQKLCMIEYMKELRQANISSFRIQFSTEKKEEIKDILNMYIQGMKGILPKKEVVDKIKKEGLTKGHFFRGVM